MRKKYYVQLTGIMCVAIVLISAFLFLDTTMAADEKIIRFATLQSPTNPMVVELQKALDEITKQTKGKIRFQKSYGTEAGFKAKEFVPALNRNLLDMSLVATSAAASDYPWLSVTGIPFVFPDLKSKGPVLRELIPMFEEFSRENGIVPLAYPYHMDNYVVIYCKEKLNTLPNIKGKLIRVYDPNTIAMVKGFGATPVNLQKSEVYMGLDKRTIDGAMTGETSAEDLHFSEVTKYMVKLTPMVLPNIVGVSRIVWNKLDKDVQNVFVDVLAKWQKEYMEYILSEAHEKKSFDYAIKHGMEILDPASDMKATFVKIKEGIVTDYLKNSGTKGKQALDLLNGALKKAGY